MAQHMPQMRRGTVRGPKMSSNAPTTPNFAQGNTPTPDVPFGPERKPLHERLTDFKQAVTEQPQPKVYPQYAFFCDNPEDFATPEKLRGFKPARVSIYLNAEEHFKTDTESDLLFYGDNEKGVWQRDGEVYLKQILAKILRENDRESHYRNILHTLKSLTYQKITFSNKIACENGLLDVETQTLTPFTLNEMAFHQINAKYDPNAECPNWTEFLKQVLNPEDIPTLQEWSGYTLLPDYRFHKLLWLHGDGRNGKGVWQRTIESILGEQNVSGVGLEELDGNHRFAVQKLYGKLFNPCSEPTTNRILQTALLKKATGQDTIDAEVKGSNKRIKFRNTAKITVIANKFPKVNDNTLAFRERRIFIKFPNEFTGKNQIQNLEKAWLDNTQERSGILNWMLQGLQRLLSQGYFTESKSQEETEIAFQRASDSISAFITEMAIFGKPLETTRNEAYEAYKDYCDFIGVVPENDKVFTQRLKNTPKIGIGKTRQTGKQERTWKGISFKQISEDMENGTDGTFGTRSVSPSLFTNSLKLDKSVGCVPNVPSVPNSEQRSDLAYKKCVNCADFRQPSCRRENWDAVSGNESALGYPCFSGKNGVVEP